MTILLTGGAGYIGSHTAVELLNAGHQVAIADNFSNSSKEAIKRIETITGKSVFLYETDINDGAALECIFKDIRIDAVVHFAALKSVGESASIPLRYYRNNLGATMSLIEVMEKYDVGNLIYSSSATVYGTPDKLPITEDMPVGPCTNPYGWTKLMTEQILRDYCAANPHFSVVLLRYFNPVGAHNSALIGEDPLDTPNNLMPFISQVAVRKLEKLYIYGDNYPTEDGTGVRDYIHVVDLAKGHLSAISYCVENRGVEVFNLGTGKGFSVMDVVNAFQRVNNVEIPYQIITRRNGDIAACYADAAKASSMLNWTAERGLDEMCRDTWNWQIKNPDGYKQGAGK